MLPPGNLADVAFRYARWLRETGQWEAMELFTFVIHPAVGALAGRGKTRVLDLHRSHVRRALAVAVQDGIDQELAYGAWEDFVAYLDAEGVPHHLLLDPQPDGHGPWAEGRGP